MPKRNLGTELCAACDKADPDRVKELLAGGANVNALGDRRVPFVCGQSPLWLTVKRASEQLPEAAWRQFSEAINAPFPKKYHQDYEGTRKRFLQIITILLDAGADIEHRSHGTTPLRMAVFGNDLEVTKFLLARGADPNAEIFSPASKLAKREAGKLKPGYLGTVLHEAVLRGHLEVAKALMEAGADPLRKDAEGRDAIAMAREMGSADMIELLAPDKRVPAKAVGKTPKKVFEPGTKVGSAGDSPRKRLSRLIDLFPKEEGPEE